MHSDQDKELSREKAPVLRSKLTYSRNRLVTIARETIEIAQRGHYTNSLGETVSVKEALDNALQGTVHYHFSHIFPNQLKSSKEAHPNPRDGENNLEANNGTINIDQQSPTTPNNEVESNSKNNTQTPLPNNEFKTQFHVVVSTALEVAMQYRGKNVGVLNSASGKIPGGRFQKGLMSHEDCLCRATLLYPCIAQFEIKPNHYYMINNALPKGTNTACAMFSPNVPVIRRDTTQGELLDEFQTCCFVTIPAPNGFILNKQTEFLEEAMKDRIFRLLSIFREHGCTELVLSAFGCGVHGNDPDFVAAMFKEFLTTTFSGQFNNVIFSIQADRHENLRAFREAFGNEETIGNDSNVN
eukprot:CAMPEP_0172520434 /NCGR_PEP_ID=MMETSP1066-20121228/291998_1 /TAXON_ID=671091 /ORGANISM="Coscinodiscus wailesii, Strain CCMP2513" /LENGTH=354 /DNA_ID=CAMNT_0013303187 /DNA_START=35 /DNA_END=1099 /DNA_ORIENTATION=+